MSIEAEHGDAERRDPEHGDPEHGDAEHRDPGHRDSGRVDAEPLWREVVGRELRRRRTTAERTLSDVADRAGISTAYLSEIERGRKEPSSEMLAAVLGALGLGLLDLTAAVTEDLTSAEVLSLPTSLRPERRSPGASAMQGPLLLAA